MIWQRTQLQKRNISKRQKRLYHPAAAQKILLKQKLKNKGSERATVHTGGDKGKGNGGSKRNTYRSKEKNTEKEKEILSAIEKAKGLVNHDVPKVENAE